MNSKVSLLALKVINPTWAFQAGDIAKIPFVVACGESCERNAKVCVEIAKEDWDSFETSWEFRGSPLCMGNAPRQMLREAFGSWSSSCSERIERMLACEEENNRVLLDVYGLGRAVSPDVATDNVNLYRADRSSDVGNLLSYAVGCAMGRYSFDQPGLIYANSGNEGFDPSQYKTFPADPDGIIPVTEFGWFSDSAVSRFEEFVGVAWPKEHLEENFQFVAESLGAKSGEDPRDTIRRYFANDFYKHHLQTYKRRPIYWLFTSGKLGAFQALVYLHRYNEGTLARMRTEYVIPLQGKIRSRVEHLDADRDKATSASHRRKIEKELELMQKQQAELRTFEEKLRHYADLRIKLDLDDGVKVNYAKFSNLLACVKQVCGKSEEDDE